MQAESFDIEKLVFDPANARLHSNKNLDAIKGSLTRFGQQSPIVVDEKNVVLKGNGTLAAAKALGWKSIWIVRADLNSVQKAAYSIADNRSGELASWDNDALSKTILSLRDEDFDLGDIGFDDLDMDKILGEPSAKTQGSSTHNDESDNPSAAKADEESDADIDQQVEKIVAPERVSVGEVWLLGAHRLICGDTEKMLPLCVEPNSHHAVVSDPPYGLSKEPDIVEVMKNWVAGKSYEHGFKGFMGKSWDSFVPGPSLWKQVFKAAKPGAHLLAFFGTRTYDIGTIAIRFAGFECREQLAWIYGSGFPKSLNISKAIDKEAGAEREVVGVDESKLRPNRNGRALVNGANEKGGFNEDNGATITAPSTPEAQRWEGFGTALKPAQEPICMARKPISESTVAKNVLKHAAGGINIDASRIQGKPRTTHTTGNIQGTAPQPMSWGDETNHMGDGASGRFPSNVLLQHAPGCKLVGTKEIKTSMGVRGRGGEVYAEGKGFANTLAEVGQKVGYGNSEGNETVEEWVCEPDCPVRILDEQSGVLKSGAMKNIKSSALGFHGNGSGAEWNHGASSGGASRFFYVAKPSGRERGEENSHATVKPLQLMRYLVKLVCPPEGMVLEPFAGSGTTLLACEKEGMACTAFELDPKHCDIILARWEKLTGKKAKRAT